MNSKLTSEKQFVVFKFANDVMWYITSIYGIPFAIISDPTYNPETLVSQKHMTWIEKWINEGGRKLFISLDYNPMHYPSVSEVTFHYGAYSFRREFSEFPYEERSFIKLCTCLAVFGIYAYKKGLFNGLNLALRHIIEATQCLLAKGGSLSDPKSFKVNYVYGLF